MMMILILLLLFVALFSVPSLMDFFLLYSLPEKSVSQEMKNLLIALALIALFAAVQSMPAGKWKRLSRLYLIHASICNEMQHMFAYLRTCAISRTSKDVSTINFPIEIGIVYCGTSQAARKLSINFISRRRTKSFHSGLNQGRSIHLLPQSKVIYVLLLF